MRGAAEARPVIKSDCRAAIKVALGACAAEAHMAALGFQGALVNNKAAIKQTRLLRGGQARTGGD